MVKNDMDNRYFLMHSSLSRCERHIAAPLPLAISAAAQEEEHAGYHESADDGQQDDQQRYIRPCGHAGLGRCARCFTLMRF